ncbi:MAG: rhamnulose-1-phosphate aldolase [Marinilabiliales bacterium]|nr:MAG: rhamnulose-1-phosphate aldolase [Marinilabiliales bacterium]
MERTYHIELQDFYAEISDTAKHLWEKGWAERNGGNISRVIPKSISQTPLACTKERIPLDEPLPGLANRIVLMTGTGTRMRDVAKNPQDNISIVAISEEGKEYMLLSSDIPPTSELPSHLRIHNFLQLNRKNHNAIVHSHPTNVVAMSHLKNFRDSRHFCNTLWKMIPETYVFLPRGIAVLPYLMPGSSKVADASVNAFSQGPDVIIWAKHGAFAIAPDTNDAFDKIDLIEKSASIYLAAKSTGEEPEGLSDEDIEELRQYYNL